MVASLFVSRAVAKARAVFNLKSWQSRKDSNLNKQSQNLLCYRYTTRLFQILPDGRGQSR
jgi:hypothetical protein